MVYHISQTNNSNIGQELSDMPIWIPSPDGRFSTKSAYELIRARRQRLEWIDYVWVKGILFKIHFFLWRLWEKKRILTDENLQRMHIILVLRCHYCEEYH